MLCVLTIAALVVVGKAVNVPAIELMPVDALEARSTFKNLVLAHGREYQSDVAEMNRRFEIFQDNVKRVEAARENERGDARYGLNQFFDLSAEEFQVRYKMPKQDIRKPTHLLGHRVGDGAVVKSCLGGGASVSKLSPAQRQALPKTYDWRQHQPAILTPVKNQGACGSCWAFSTVETLESAWALKGNPLVKLSPQQVVDCSHDCSMEDGQKVCNQGCQGGWPWAAAHTLITEGGAEAEATYPYTAQDGQCMFNKAKVVAQASNFTCISGPHTAHPDDMATALLQQPLSIALNAEWFQFYLGGVSDPYLCGTTSLDHAVQIVGYGEQPGWITATVKYWVIRNSWGESWGEDGYIKLKKGSNVCGVGNAVMQIVAK